MFKAFRLETRREAMCIAARSQHQGGCRIYDWNAEHLYEDWRKRGQVWPFSRGIHQNQRFLGVRRGQEN
jgi:hypothetical protein